MIRLAEMNKRARSEKIKSVHVNVIVFGHHQPKG